MSFFNFRRGGSSSVSPAGSAAQPESVEVMRKRAKHRLIGSAVLVLIGVVGFPLLFDTQPRPIPVDIPIEIPGKNAVKPLSMPAPAAATAPAPVVTPAEKVAAAASLAPQEEIVPSKQPSTPVEKAPAAIKKEAKTEAKAEARIEARVEPKPAPKPAAVAHEAARASALLNGDTAAPGKHAASDADGRVVVQVGAFADVAKAREARVKLEKAGLKTYTQVAETKDGKRIRVRVGPFATRADAEKAASKIKTLDLPAAILTL